MIKTFYEKHKVSLSVFVYLILYNFIVANQFSIPEVSGLCYSFHVVDFSLGFCSKLLPGAIYSFLVGRYDVTSVTIYETTLTLLCFVSLSLTIERAFRKVKKENRVLFLGIVFFALSGPFSISAFTTELGSLDGYWLYLTVVFLMLISNDIATLFVPVICLLASMVYYSAIICYLPFYVLLLLLKFVNAKTKRQRLLTGIAFIVSLLVSVGSAFYFVLFEKGNLTTDLVGFDELLLSRGVSEDSLYYYDYAFFGTMQGADTTEYYKNIYVGDSVIMNFVNRLAVQLQITDTFTSDKVYFYYTVFKNFTLSLPMTFFIANYYKQIRKDDDKFIRKIIYSFPIMLFLCTFLFGFLFSTDRARWVAHGYVGLVSTFIFVLLFRNNDEEWNYLKAKLKTVSASLVIIYILIYFFTRGAVYG